MGQGARSELVADPFIALFPRLAISGYKIMSAATVRYNCIAWAAARDDRFWWPDPDAFWPTDAPFEETLEAFEAAYATLGYTRCDNEALEPGFEKIVIYLDAVGAPTHAARQLPSGRWTSKLGSDVDIEHASPEALSGRAYGSPVLIMRRPQKGLLPSVRRWIREMFSKRRSTS